MDNQIKEKQIAKNIGIIGLVSIISKFFGFARDALLSYIYGAGNITDAFNISSFLPNFIFMVLQQAIAISFIPIFLSLDKKDSKKANGFTNNVLLVSSIISIIFSFFLFAFAGFFVHLFASGFSDDTYALAVRMVKFTSWSLFLQSLVVVFTSFLQAKKSFLIPSLMGMILDVTVGFFAVFSSKVRNPALLGFAPLVSAIIQTLFLFLASVKNGYRFTKISFVKGEGFFQMIKLAGPAIITTGISQINYFVDKNVVTNVVVGGVTTLSLASNLVNAVETIVVSSLATVLYSEFSEMSANEETDNMVILLNKVVNLTLLLIIPLSFLIVSCSTPIIDVLYGHGSFSSDAVFLTANCLRSYSLGMMFIAVSTLMIRFFYSVKKPLCVVVASSVSLVVNIVLDILVWKITDFGAPGIAAATSIGAFVNCFLLFCFLQKYVQKRIFLPWDEIIKEIAICIFCTFLALFFQKFISEKWFHLFYLFVGLGTFGVIGFPLFVVCCPNQKNFFLV